MVNDSAGVADDEKVGGDLDQVLDGLNLILCSIKLELCFEHLEGVGLLILWVIRLGLQDVAVGVAPGPEIDQVIHGLVEELVDQLIVVGQGVDVEWHQRITLAG